MAHNHLIDRLKKARYMIHLFTSEGHRSFLGSALHKINEAFIPMVIIIPNLVLHRSVWVMVSSRLMVMYSEIQLFTVSTLPVRNVTQA